MTDIYTMNFRQLYAHVTSAPHLFALLGVSADADQRELDIARRRLAWIAHPDRNIDEPHAGRLMSIINDAHLRITVGKARRSYLATYGGNTCPGCRGTGQVTRQTGLKREPATCLACLGCGRVK
jgi:DnaJ-class molecular chaperone